MPIREHTFSVTMCAFVESRTLSMSRTTEGVKLCFLLRFEEHCGTTCLRLPAAEACCPANSIRAITAALLSLVVFPSRFFPFACVASSAQPDLAEPGAAGGDRAGVHGHDTRGAVGGYSVPATGGWSDPDEESQQL